MSIGSIKPSKHFSEDARQEKPPASLGFAACISTIAFAIHKAAFPLSVINSSSQKSAIFALRCIAKIAGEIKTCTLRKNASGDWDISLSCQVNVEPLAPQQEAIGIDVGLKHFATLSNGEAIDNPRFFKQEEKALAKAQRKLAVLKIRHPKTSQAR